MGASVLVEASAQVLGPMALEDCPVCIGDRMENDREDPVSTEELAQFLFPADPPVCLPLKSTVGSPLN